MVLLYGRRGCRQLRTATPKRSARNENGEVLGLATSTPGHLEKVSKRDGTTWPSQAHRPRLDLRLEFTHDQAAAETARRAVEGALSDGEPLDAVVLATSELVSNVIRHTDDGGTLHLWRRRVDGPLRLDVHDPSSTLPSMDDRAPSASCGFGLGIVAAVADRWGAKRTKTGKLVWAEFSR
jgi:hypothetical protein